MSLDDAYSKFEQSAAEALEWFKTEIAHLRTGRVTPDAVTNIMVEHYGARTPLQGLASITSIDARTLVISPWDPSAMAAIEKAIITAEVGVQPAVDGKIIRLAFPMLTEEMRETVVKKLNKTAEEAKVRLRRGRDEALGQLKSEMQSSDITEDDFYSGREELNKRIAAANEEIDSLTKSKEEEIKQV
jgi:ribosome recycling factor